MVPAESPVIRGKDRSESPRSSKSLRPVTPGVNADGLSAYNDPSTPTPDTADIKAPSQNAKSYFEGQQTPRSHSPAMVAAGAKSAEELLRRLSLSKNALGGGEKMDKDPRGTHPNLSLSGRIISATFVLPFNIQLIENCDWNLGRRMGTSAMFSSYTYLSSPESNWDHTILAWTGEIVQKSQGALDEERLTDKQRAILRASAPIPVDPKQKSSIPASKGIKVDAAMRKKLEKLLEQQKGEKYVPVWLADDANIVNETYILKDQRRWCRFSEQELYNLFHYKQNEPTDGRQGRKSWADYYKMNKIFADRIIEVYKPGDIVVVHDHQLLLLPSLLRQRIPNIYIGFFLHIPFPSSELYRCLPQRKELLEGVLGSNMVGFQSYSYSRHFSSCCTRILGFESSSAGVDAYGAHVAVDVFPIGINVEELEKAAFNDPTVEENVRRIRQTYGDKKIIVGRDRLDAVRGLAQKFQAFEVFLERYPEWQEKVVLIQITSATERNAEQEKADQKYVNKIADLVTKINGEYGTLNFAPIQHHNRYLDRNEYLALLRVADLGLITIVRDGMNTTSLEYIVCQKENHGPLILSEFSGTAASLSKAVHVNPWDLGGVADEINSALRMSDAQRTAQHDKLYKYVVNNDVQAWTTKFLSRLLTNLSSFDQSFATPALDRTHLLEQYRAAKKRLFMFDYDGTLTPIVKDPNAAVPSDRVLRTLKTLSSDPANEVWIISGRDQKFLDEWMGHISELGLSAEHGSFMRSPKSEDWENISEGMDMSWRDEVLRIFGYYTERTQGSFIETKKIAVTWHYRRADPEYGAYQARECQRELEAKVTRHWDVEVMTGKANLEVRPRFVNKGDMARRLIEQSSANGPLGFVLCLGDDYTDEDMFRSLRQSKLPAEAVFSVTVGASSKQTLASWHLLEPSDVISVLGLLNGSIDRGNVGAASVVEGRVPETRI